MECQNQTQELLTFLNSLSDVQVTCLTVLAIAVMCIIGWLVYLIIKY